MEITNEKHVGKKVELELSLDKDEYNDLYERYKKEKALKKDSDNYSFDDFMQEMFDVIMLEMECEILSNELKEQEKELKFKKGELQARIDGNNS